MIIKDENVAIISDTHIGAHQNSALWHSISLEFAEWLDVTLKARGITDIIITGDVNNDRAEISVNSLHVVNDFFKILKDYNINVLVGNHDAYFKSRSDVNSLSLLSGWKNVHIIDKVEEYEVFGKKLGFCPWGTEAIDVPECNYLFGHFEINGFKLTKLKVCNKGVDSKNLLDKTDMVITGHLHLRDDREYKKGKRILYVGSPYELDWSDCGTEPRGFYTLDIPTGNYEFVENIVSPRHKKIRLSEITSAGKLTDDIRKEFKNNFINFIVDVDKDYDKIATFIQSLNKLGAKNIRTEYILEDRTTLEDRVFDFTAVDIPNTISEFIKMTDVEHEEEVLKEILELYDKCKKVD